MSRIGAARAAAPAGAAALAGRRRRTRHRHHRGARPGRLGARHRSAHADRRRRGPDRCRASRRSPRNGRGAPARRRTTVGRLRQPRCSAAPRSVWKDIFSKDGQTYRAPVLVLYRGATDARCGGAAQSAMGPFYCPADQKIYLDTSFFRSDRDRASAAATRQQGVPILAGLCDRARGRPSRAEPARHPAEGAAAAARRRQQGRGQPHPGQGRTAGRLPRRRLGQPGNER